MNEKKEFIKEAITLALPAGFQMLINNVVQMIDSIMIGQLGDACISAVSVSGTFLWLATTIITGIAGGASIIAAQDYGRKELDRIKKLVSIVLVFALLTSIVFYVLIDFYSVQIFKIYSNIDAIIEPGCQYLGVMKYTLFFNLISLAIVIMLRSIRNVKLGLMNSILSCFTNIFFNWVFIFGHLGFPAMGIVGAAVGTLVARIIEFLVCIVYFLFIEKELHYKIADFSLSLDNQSFINLVKITLPLLAIDVLNNLLSSVQTMITGRISDYYISANAIVHNCWTLPNVFLWGISMASAVMIGNSIGAGKIERAKNDSKRFVVVAVICGIFSAVMVQILLPILSSFYQVSNETLVLAKQMSYSASISVLFLSTTIILCEGTIKAGGYTDRILKINIIANWLVAIPLGFLAAFVFKWHAAIIYLLLRSGNFVRTVWGLIQLKKDNWIKVI